MSKFKEEINEFTERSGERLIVLEAKYAGIQRRIEIEVEAMRLRERNIEQLAQDLFGSLQKKLNALYDYLGLEHEWVEPKTECIPGHYRVTKVSKKK